MSDLEERLAEVCPDHESCEHCGAVLCESCGIGDPATRCESVPPFVHCVDCPCRACQIEMGLDVRAEAYADMKGWKY